MGRGSTNGDYILKRFERGGCSTSMRRVRSGEASLVSAGAGLFSANSGGCRHGAYPPTRRPVIRACNFCVIDSGAWFRVSVCVHGVRTVTEVGRKLGDFV